MGRAWGAERMFFRRWRAQRREAIARRWIAEHKGSPLAFAAAQATDPVGPPHAQPAHTAERAGADPLAALYVDKGDIAAKVEALWEWQTHFVPWLGDILRSHHDSLDFLEGHRIRLVRQMSPFESMLDCLIRTHPRPDLLLRVWNQHVPLVIDDLSEMPEGLNESHQEDALAWQAVVRHYTQLIEQAAAHFEKHRDDD